MELCTNSYNILKEAALRPIVDLLREDISAHVCIFVNFHAEVGKVGSALNGVMAESLLRVGVLSTNGTMDKNETFAFVRFTLVLRVEWQPSPQIQELASHCVSTSYALASLDA